MDENFKNTIGNLDDFLAGKYNEALDIPTKEAKIFSNKIMIVLNDTLVNGQNHDGEILFIPYSKDDPHFRNADGFYHNNYACSSLGNYTIVDGNNELTNLLNQYKSGVHVNYNDTLNAMLSLGFVPFYDLNDNFDVRFKQGGLFLPENLSDKQKDTICNKIVPEFNKEFYRISLAKYMTKENSYYDSGTYWGDEVTPAIKNIYEKEKAHKTILEQGANLSDFSSFGNGSPKIENDIEKSQEQNRNDILRD